VGVLKNIPVGVPKIKKIKKITTSQDDVFVGGLKKNTPNRLTLVGLASWAKFSRPFGTLESGSNTPSKARLGAQTTA
jgi:hypothetical protein